MLLILEGVDNVGKSWLAERLANETDGDIRHWGPIKSHPLEEYELPLQDYDPTSGKTVICDRLHLGEAVYGPLYRGESRLDPISWAHIEMFLASRGAVLVHLSESLNVLRRRHADEGEDFLKVEHLEHVVREYVDIVAASNIRQKITARTTDIGLVDDVVRAGIDERGDAIPAFQLTEGRYIGAPTPSLLLIGEQRNLDPRGFTSPFVPFARTSGHYLLDALLTTGVNLRDLGVINAVEDEANLHELWELLRRPLIVTLGSVANRILDAAELPHGAATHPQYARRFLHSHLAWYGSQVQRAAYRQADLTQERP